MKFVLSVFLFAFLIIPVNCYGQDAANGFPDDYFGIYKGELEIYTERGNYEIPMEFQLLPTDSLGRYTYTLVYGAEAERQERPYSLLEIDAAKGEYLVDEHNGILLDSKVIGNKIYSLFEVQGNLLTTFMTFSEDHLLFEITFAARSKARISKVETQEDTEVISYPISTVQKAKLLKQ